jgi:ABC-2 type transport system ATP-binding protein
MSLPETIIPALQVDHLHKRYKGAAQPAVADLSFSIQPGEIFGLLGPNGAGKTTAISIITTLLNQDAGTVKIHGNDIRTCAHSVKKVIGLVPQNIALYREMTVMENLRFFGRLHGFHGAELNTRIEDVLTCVGMHEHAGKIIAKCSGGIQRRANLAAGIIHAPTMVFLDEPTVGIDAQSRNLILEKLIEKKKAGMTLLYTTHYMEEAEQICDRILIMDKGQALITGTATELLQANPDCKSLQDLFFKLTGKSLRD